MSKIAWTNITFNCVTGCNPYSAGCLNCYARPMATRMAFNPNPKTSYKYRNGFEFTEHPEELEKDIGGKNKLIFLNSMSDTFHENISETFLRGMFDFIRRHPQHIFQVLTKRASRLALIKNYPSNVWLGVTVERSDCLDRIEYLMDTNASVKWVSCEPLLGPIESDEIKYLDWVVVGGESGPKCRPMNLDWARKIRDICEAHDVPFFFKQAGGRGKDKGGKMLDGKTYNQWPKSFSWDIPRSEGQTSFFNGDAA
jgi:protein gp37